MKEHNTQIEAVLRKMANTIIVNLGNTTGIGLFDGKLGLCIFLYEYARISGYKTYEGTASSLLDDVLKGLSPTMDRNIINGVAGIGCGLIRLLHKGFIETDSNDLLNDIDTTLFTDINKLLIKEDRMSKAMFSSGIYLIHRLRYLPDARNSEWTSQLITDMEKFVDACLKFEAKPSLSLLNSMMFVCNALSSCGAIGSTRYNDISKMLMELVGIVLKDMKYDASDIMMLESINSACKSIVPNGNVLNKNKYDAWYKCSWEGWLCDIDIANPDTQQNVCKYLDDKMQNAFYDLNTVNSYLAAAGLCIINKYNL